MIRFVSRSRFGYPGRAWLAKNKQSAEAPDSIVPVANLLDIMAHTLELEIP